MPQPLPPAPKAPDNSKSSSDKSTPDSSPSDAAERHIKRTNCLKDARAKKIVGAQRNAYVKSCMEAGA